MKKFSVIPLIAALAFFVSCQKQQTEEERKAEVERQVQDRLATERVEAEKKRIEEDRAKLEAREKAVADREQAAAASPAPKEEAAAATMESDTPIAERVESEPRSSAAYGMFYEKLDPYGDWRETSDYGYVWQPREAESSRDWRPYTEGRWVYSDAGWTWVSDEPFGWATYHYGRWARLRRVGWVWVPGNEWAPAWVSWRTNKDYVGWAPLPPEARFDRRSGIQNWADSYYDIGPDQYSFVPSNDFSAEHVRRSVVPAERNVTIVVETTNVTRITFSKTTIVNEGPSYDELRSRSQRPIERYRLRREQNTEATARISGNELQVSIPVLNEVQNVFRPRRVKERVTDVNVDNGWTSVSDRSAAERARTKIRAEATPPPNAPPKKFVPPADTSTASVTPAAAEGRTPASTNATATVAKASPTPASAASATPAASASPRIRPSATPRTEPSPSIAASPAATTPAVAATPISTPVASPRAAIATPTPPTAITPPVRMRPSPSIPSRPPQTPPAVQRRVPPITPTPATTPAAESQPATTPAPTFTPPPRRSNVPPRPTLTPANTADTVQPPMPRDNPKRIMPPRMTPPPAATPVATPNTSPSVPAPNNDRARNRRPKPPVPGATESGTPTPAPSTAPQ